MKRLAALLLALVMVLTLAACGSGDKPADQTGTAPEASSGKTDQTTQSASKPDESKPDESKPADAGKTEEEPAKEGSIDQFVFRTSDETRAFLQTYNPSVKLDYGEPYWRQNSKELTMEGHLTPDKTLFTALNVRANNPDDKELLLAFYREFCEKSGLAFSGAEEGIQQIDTLEDTAYYEADGYWLGLNRPSMGYGPGLYIVRVHSEYGSIPYGPDDAYAYMQSHNGWPSSLRRSVSGNDEMDWNRNRACPYGWSGELNQNDCLSEVEAEYYEEDPEAAKAYFKAFAEFYLTGDVLEEAANFLSEKFDAIEQGGNESVTIAEYYYLNLSHYSCYRCTIRLTANEIPSTAQPFPSAEEQAALLLDPITRRGIDKDALVPETVLYERGSMKVVLEREFYTDSNLTLQLRFENVPEEARVRVELEKINGQPIEPVTEIDWYSAAIELSAGKAKDPVVVKTINVSLDSLQEVYEYTGLQSLSFDGLYGEYDENDNQTQFEWLDEVTAEAAK